jgi:integrase
VLSGPCSVASVAVEPAEAEFQLAIRRWQLLDRNPVLAVDWPKAPPYNARISTRLERQRLLPAAEPFFRPFILVGMYTGLRKGSILRLEAENYLNEPGILRVIQKSGRELRLRQGRALSREARSEELEEDPEGPGHPVP